MGQEGNQKGNLKTPWNKNGNATYQNLWGAAKAVLRRKFIPIYAYNKNKKAHK